MLATVAVGSLLIVALLPTLQSDRENLRRAICANNPDMTPPDNPGTDGRNVLFTDSHVEWINGPDVSYLFAPIQADWGNYGIDNPAISPQVLGQQDGI